jgi:hypothetical protein
VGGGGGNYGPTGSGPVIRVTDVRNGAGTSVVNKVTNDNLPNIVGIGPAGDSITVFADGKALGKTIVDTTGYWAMEAPRALSNGVHRFSGVQTGHSATGAASLQTTVWAKAPTITVTVPAYADAQTPPTITVNVANAPFGYDPTIHYDVQLSGDSQFTNDYQVTTDTSLTLWALPRGTDVIRVRVTDNVGNVGIGTATMQVDPYAGYIGDQDLLKLATGWYNSPYNAPNSVPGAWGLGGLSGGGSGSMGGAPGGMGGGPGGSGGFGSGNGRSPQQIFIMDSQGDVLIDARATMAQYYKTFQQELQTLGMNITLLDSADYLVEGYLPVNQIMALNTTPYFSAATPVYQALRQAGPGAQEGDAVIGGPQFRATTGADGTGIRVGVLSDSVNEVGNGIADSVAVGALPKSGVTLLEDMPNGPGTDEGRAMLEIVHKVAPGATLGFHTGANGVLDMATGITELQTEFHANVIADDIRFPDSPMFSDGRLGIAVDQVVANGAVYATAAGNYGSTGFRAPWSGAAGTVGNVTGVFQNFGGGQPLQPFTLAPGDSISMSFFWDAAYLEAGSVRANFQVPNNLVAYVEDAVTGNIVGTFNTGGPNINEAFQDIQFTNSTTDNRFYFAFQLQSGPAPQAIGWILYGVFDANMNQIVNGDIKALDEGAPTQQGQALAPGALTVAAAPWFNPTVPETFSSLGGHLQIFSDDNGNRFTTPTFINKPDVMAPDSVQVSFKLDNQPTFQGTSAATPHVAAAAALLEDQNPLVDNVEIDRFLRITTESRLVPGFDDTAGHGLIHLQELNFAPGIFQPNGTSDAAFGLGNLGLNKMVITSEVGDSGTGLPDFDWFTVNVTHTGALTVVMDNPDIEVHVFAFSTDPLGQVINGFTTQVPLGTVFSAGSVAFIEVKGTPTGPDSFTTGVYNLGLEID